MNKLLFLLFLLFLIPTVSGTSYYVSNDGNDANDGTSQITPWETIAKVNSELKGTNPDIQLGDDIYFKCGDTFEGELDLRIGGEEGNPMIISSYGTGAKPILRNPNGISDNCIIKIWYDISGYYTIQDLEIKDTQSPGDGIHVSLNNHNDIIIKNIDASNMGGNEAIFMDKVVNFEVIDITAIGCSLTFYGDPTERLSNGKIHNCYIEPSPAGRHGLCIHRSDSANTNMDIDGNIWVKNVEVVSNGNTFNAIDLTAGTNIIVEDCKVSQGGGMGFGIDHEITNLLIQNCKVFDHDSGGFVIANVNNVIIRNNEVNNVAFDAFKLETSLGEGFANEDGYTTNLCVYNNDFTQPVGYDGTNKIFPIDYDYLVNVNFKNNIFAAYDYTTPAILYRVYGGAVMPPSNELNFENNIWWHGSGDSTAKWNTGSTSLDINGWNNYYPSDIFTNPQTTSTKDLGTHLTTTTNSGTRTYITVENPYYFTDGLGMITGDSIQVGDNNPVTITNIDYPSKTISFDDTITFNTGDTVSIEYDGDYPDVGKTNEVFKSHNTPGFGILTIIIALGMILIVIKKNNGEYI